MRACNGLFRIQIKNPAGNTAAYSITEARKKVRFRLPADFYMVQVNNLSCLNPGEIAKWLQAVPEENYSLTLLFSRPLNIPATLPANFTIYEVNYPDITDLNGEITAWHHPITPLAFLTDPPRQHNASGLNVYVCIYNNPRICRWYCCTVYHYTNNHLRGA